MRSAFRTDFAWPINAWEVQPAFCATDLNAFEPDTKIPKFKIPSTGSLCRVAIFCLLFRLFRGNFGLFLLVIGVGHVVTKLYTIELVHY